MPATPDCRGLVCIGNTCANCTSDGQCGPGAKCCRGACYQGLECCGDADCEQGERCVNGTCKGCQRDSDCGALRCCKDCSGTGRCLAFCELEYPFGSSSTGGGFSLGTGLGTSTDGTSQVMNGACVAGSLCRASAAASPPTPYVWVVATGEGRISRYDTRTGVRSAAWPTGVVAGWPGASGEAPGDAPSATAVNVYDDTVWTANRGTGRGQSGLAHLGFDGVMQCYAPVPGGASGVTLDSRGDAWVGALNGNVLYKFSGSEVSRTTTPATCKLLATLPVPLRPVALTTDEVNRVWAVGTDGRIVVVDTSGVLVTRVFDANCSAGGLAVDASSLWVSCVAPGVVVRVARATGQRTSVTVGGTPGGLVSAADGFVYVGTGGGVLVKVDKRMLSVSTVALSGASQTALAAIDSQGQVWAIDATGPVSVVRASGATELFAGSTLGQAPNGDVTGQQFVNVGLAPARWTAVYDAGHPSPRWLSLRLSASTPAGTGVRVRVRSAGSQVTLAAASWSDWMTLFPSSLASVPQRRFLEIDAALTITRAGTTPQVGLLAPLWAPPESLVCLCPPGSTRQGGACVDVDECAVNNGGCSENALCTNTPGGWWCACRQGYTGDGIVCTDVNECGVKNGGCPGDQVCTNIAGGSRCCPRCNAWDVTEQRCVSSVEFFDVQVSGVTSPVFVSPPGVTGLYFSPTQFSAQATVDTRSTVVYSLSGNPAWMSINPTTGLITGTPTNNTTHPGTTSVTVRAVSECGSAATKTFTVEVRKNQWCGDGAGQCSTQPQLCAPGVNATDVGCQCVESCRFTRTSRPFSPIVKYSWGNAAPPTATDVMMAPIVTQLTDDDGDGRITARDTPEIVVVTFARGDYQGTGNGVVRALTVRQGVLTQLWERGGLIYPMSQLASGNIDGLPGNEIVGCSPTGTVALRADGSVLWQSPTATCAYPAFASIADLDGDGNVEVVTQSKVLDGRDGSQKGAYPSSSNPIVADVNGDGVQDIVMADRVVSPQGATLASVTGPSGFVAVGDLNRDGRPEMVSVNTGSHLMSIWSYDPTAPTGGRLVRSGVDINGPVSPARCPAPSYGSYAGGGPPTIGDFNADGFPDVALAGGVGYVVFDGKKLMDGVTPGPQTILWIRETQDCSSAATGSTLFDFDGDGSVEVVYADEVNLHVYNAADGTELFTTCNTSGTLTEYPLVADIDNDSQADLIVVSNAYALTCVDGSGLRFSGVRVFGSSNNDWVVTRPVWNQHAYSVTNIEEDGVVPRSPASNWLVPGLNNFRQNKQPGLEFAAADAVASVSGLCTASGVRYCASITNVGEAVFPGGATVQLVANPAGAPQVLTTFTSTRALGPAQSEFFTWLGPVSLGATPVAARVQSATARECRTSNNTSTATLACAGSACSGPGCTGCVAGVACTSNPTPCLEGRTSCVAGVEACVDATVARAEGVACGAGKVCSATGACVQLYTVQFSASRNDVDLRSVLTSAPYGWNGTTPVWVSVTIDPGVVIGATSSTAPAFSTGALPPGSRVRLVNRGRIQGKGGNGGNGGGQITLCHPTRNGQPGGVALQLSVPTQLDNTSGALWGGGGGGAGACNVCGTASGGGGGGGGAGTAAGTGGSGGGGPSRAGGSGTATAGGAGGGDFCGGGGNGAAGGGPGLPGLGNANASGSATGGAAGVALAGQSLVTDIGASPGDRRGGVVP